MVHLIIYFQFVYIYSYLPTLETTVIYGLFFVYDFYDKYPRFIMS